VEYRKIEEKKEHKCRGRVRENGKFFLDGAPTSARSFVGDGYGLALPAGLLSQMASAGISESIRAADFPPLGIVGAPLGAVDAVRA
jgi:hypothetical protein